MGQVDNEISSLRKKMEKTLDYFKNELNSFHSGRASTSLVENLKIPYYGQSVPLNSLANIVVIDVLNLSIEPYDQNSKTDIIQGLNQSNLGCSVIEEGQRIRLNFLPLSEERKQEIVKLLHQKKEEAKVVLRQEREAVWAKIQAQELKKSISEDDKYRAEELLNKLITDFNQKVEDLASAKEGEIKK